MFQIAFIVGGVFNGYATSFIQHVTSQSIPAHRIPSLDDNNVFEEYRQEERIVNLSKECINYVIVDDLKHFKSVTSCVFIQYAVYGCVDISVCVMTIHVAVCSLATSNFKTTTARHMT